MKVLVLTTVLPARKLHGSEVASQNIIEALQHNGCDVTVLGYGRKEDGELHIAPHEVLVSERSVETKQAKLKALGWFAFSVIKRLPYSSAKYISSDYIKRVQSLLNTQSYDAIVIDHAQIGWLLDVVKHPKIALIAHNLEHEIYRQHYERSQNRLAKWVYRREAKLIKRLEARVASAAQEVWTLTQHDTNYFAQFTNARTLSLPSSFANLQAEPIPKAFDIGIIGSWSWKPNEEGLRWFLETVYPLLPPSLSVHVAGRGADWITESYPNIHYRGFVEDSKVFMMQARVMAIPTLSGGGIQIKTLDAIASGSHIVGTSTALRGIANPPRTVSIADQPQQFAQQLIAAVGMNCSIEDLEESQQWYRDRQARFLHEVNQALQNLKPTIALNSLVN
ncbi:glycosyltransferase [Leptolyngbya sp. NIES-2104]|uniref:glycosyltransferase n=1 Tax=Leptolyngbya sp. NIES-2104 TaxID=1552121 RepID=UPI0006EC5E89|nr:glycosyltransferase [Leptolyngbya sp. NIES-2104]GAP94675.1 glycosyltransferase [Leptolyngbya sp. NIES-2104]